MFRVNNRNTKMKSVNLLCPLITSNKLSPLHTLAYLVSNKADATSIFVATEHAGAFD